MTRGIYLKDGEMVNKEVLGATQYYVCQDELQVYYLMGEKHDLESTEWVAKDDVTIVETDINARAH